MTMRNHGHDIQKIVEIAIDHEENADAKAQREAALVCAALLRDEAQPTVFELAFAVGACIFAIAVCVLLLLGADRVFGMFR